MSELPAGWTRATLGVVATVVQGGLIGPLVQRLGAVALVLAVITLRRIDEDKCKQDLVQGVELKWSFEELGLAPGSPVSVNNPYQLPQT